MSAADISLGEWVGAVKVLAEAEGWEVVTSSTALMSQAVAPTLVLNHPDRGTLAVKLKSEAAFRAKENEPRGGLSKGQAAVRDRWSGPWVTWCPSLYVEAVAVLSGGAPTDSAENAREAALTGNGAKP